MHSEKYPLRFLSEAYRILRSYRIGRLKSLQPNPDKPQVSQRLAATNWHGPEGSFSLDIESEDHALWLNLRFCLADLQSEFGNDERFRAFKANRIGIANPDSDTGDAITINLQRLAEHEGRSVSTIHRWIEKVEEEFESILQKRGLLPEEAKDDRAEAKATGGR